MSMCTDPTITTRAEYVLEGLTVCPSETVLCTECLGPLHEGRDIVVHAYVPGGVDTWNLSLVFCEKCHPPKPPGNLGVLEVTADARLAIASDAGTQASRLVLSAVDVRHLSRDSDGV